MPRRSRRRSAASRAVAPEGRASVTVVGQRPQLDDQRHRQHQRLVRDRQLDGSRRGRTFTDDEQTAGAAVCIIGETVRREMFGGTRGLGEQLRIKQFSCEVIGVLGVQGPGRDGQRPGRHGGRAAAHAAAPRDRQPARSNTLLVSMEDGSDADAPQGRACRSCCASGASSPTADDDNFNVLDTQQLAETLSGTTKVMTTLLGAVAAVSLLVGGIGIMNIMLVSVTERTREIGAAAGHRRAGARGAAAVPDRGRDAGGDGRHRRHRARHRRLASCWRGVMDVPFLFDPAINVLSFVFSAAIGVLFGYFPARRAARLDPIEACGTSSIPCRAVSTRRSAGRADRCAIRHTLSRVPARRRIRARRCRGRRQRALLRKPRSRTPCRAG